MSTATLTQPELEGPWPLPSKGRVGMICVIIAESAIFTIFVVAYVYNLGKVLTGPTPHEVLTVPIFSSICLLSSSLTIVLAERAIERNRIGRFSLWWAITIALGSIFLIGTGIE